MKMGLKLVFAFVAVASLVAIVSYINSTSYSGVLSAAEKVYQRTLVEIMSASEMSLALHVSQIAAHDLLTDQYRHRRVPARETGGSREESSDRQLVQRSLTTFEQWLSVSKLATLTEIQQAQEAGKSVGESEETASRLENLAHEYAKHARLMDRFLQLTLQSGVDDANEFLKAQVQTHFDGRVLPLVRAHQEDTEATLLNQVIAARRAFARARKLNMGVTIVALMMAITLGLLMARSIAKPIRTLKEAALRIGKGELNTKIQVGSSDEIGVLANTFNQMTTELEKTTVSKTYVDNIIQSMGEMLIVVDADDRIETVNRATVRELELSKDELLRKRVTMLFPDNDIPQAEPAGTHAALVRTGEHSLVTKSGSQIPVCWSGSELRAVDGTHQGAVYLATNITEQKRVEEQLRTSLNEKKVLLKEIHHRVKNNLQIVSSLLRLQAMRACDPETERLFHESEHQIRSMALIHEQLYRSQDLANIDFVQYVHTLARYLERSYGKEAQRITLHIDVDPVQLSIDEAIPCALLINELASNAMGHAFPQGQGGEIWIAFKTNDGRRMLSVRDNGIGLAQARASNGASNKTLGMDLVRALVKQLDAKSEVGNERGTHFVITFEGASTKEGSTAAV